MCLQHGLLHSFNMLQKHSIRAATLSPHAGDSGLLDADVGILARLLSSSPLRMLCLQDTGTPPLSHLPAALSCTFSTWQAHRSWRQGMLHWPVAAIYCTCHTQRYAEHLFLQVLQA